ncbi:Major facilitator superfamily domain-containing protein [Rhodotorula toruloides]|uniref:Major facilitator superfamily domain-containing protein n=1 Tax=Rhodotorula toruloides TaxID=5286 RepID=A0A2T0ADL4_RHOTO|nr:Major facilitator superfamily domain-containing protein [Rhodotorula toruloides]
MVVTGCNGLRYTQRERSCAPEQLERAPTRSLAMPSSPHRNSLAPPPSNQTSTSAAPSNTASTPRIRYQSGHVLDHIDSYILRGEDMTHSPGESRLPSPVPSIRAGADGERRGKREEEEEERTLTSGSANGGAGRDGLDDAAKGLRSRKVSGVDEGEKRRSNKEDSGGEQLTDPATRQWKNDVVTFDSKDDPANPKNWTFRRRYFLVALLGMTTMCSTFASSIFSTATPAVAAEFGVSTEVATLGTSLFLCGFILGPIIFGPLSEVYGRKTIFIGTFAFICFSAGTATAKDLQTIMLTRFWAGVGASAAPSVVGGALADMFDARERATAVVFYSLAIVAGPTVSPVIGSAVTYLVVILSSFVGLISVVVVPETFASVILTRKAKKLRFETKRWALHSKHEENDFSLKHFAEKTLTRPILMLVKEPTVTAICTYNFFTCALFGASGTLYLLFSSVPIIFEEGHGWTPVQSSLTFLAVLVGTLIAAFINYLYSRFVFARHIDKHGSAPPEMRLGPMMVGGIVFPVGFFLLGWAPVAGKIVGLAFVGVAFLLIFQAGVNYLIDAYLQYSASAIAANTFLRSIFASALPLIAMPLFHNLGVGFACTLLGCIAAVLGVVPFAFYRSSSSIRSSLRYYGPQLRGMSSFAKAG